MNNNYFVIHGSYGNPYKNWIPWLKRQLSKRKLNCIAPSFPTPYKQNYESWSTILKSYLKIGYITENTSFITHSLGGTFIIKFLLENKIKVKKIITIAGFNNLKFNDDMNLYNSFYLDKNLSDIKNYSIERISFYSDNDPYVPESDALKFSDSILAQKVFVKGAGHFNEKYGYLEFAELLKYI